VPRRAKVEPVFGHPLRDALLTLIDRNGSTTSTAAARELGESTGSCSFHLRRLEVLGLIEPVPDAAGRIKPWRRTVAHESTLNRELEDLAYASWLEQRTESEHPQDFAFSEVVSLTEGQLWELRARLRRVVQDFGAETDADSTATAVVIRAFPMNQG
jgi:predicted ArsR family transcriptional regulator